MISLQQSRNPKSSNLVLMLFTPLRHISKTFFHVDLFLTWLHELARRSVRLLGLFFSSIFTRSLNVLNGVEHLRCFDYSFKCFGWLTQRAKENCVRVESWALGIFSGESSRLNFFELVERRSTMISERFKYRPWSWSDGHGTSCGPWNSTLTYF